MTTSRENPYIIIFVMFCLLVPSTLFSQSFSSSFFFNANGIQIQGQDVAYWSGGGGEVWGTGGLSVGGSVKRSFSDHIYIALEIRYIRKGSIYEFLTESGVVAYETLKLNYFEVPVLFGYRFRPHGKYRIVESGIAVSRLFSSRLAINDLTQRKGTPAIYDFKDWDFSWVGTMKFPLNRRKKDNLLFGIRVEHSFVSIHNQYRLYNFVYGLQLEVLL